MPSDIAKQYAEALVDLLLVEPRGEDDAAVVIDAAADEKYKFLVEAVLRMEEEGISWPEWDKLVAEAKKLKGGA